MQLLKGCIGIIFIIVGVTIFPNMMDSVRKDSFAFVATACLTLLSLGAYLIHSLATDGVRGSLLTIKDLDVAVVYTVVSITKKMENNKKISYLLLQENDEIKAYRLEREMPEAVAPEKCILKTVDERIVVMQ